MLLSILDRKTVTHYLLVVPHSAILSVDLDCVPSQKVRRLLVPAAITLVLFVIFFNFISTQDYGFFCVCAYVSDKPGISSTQGLIVL